MGAGWYFLLGCAIGVIGIVWEEIEKHKTKKRTGKAVREQGKQRTKRDSRRDAFAAICGAIILADLLFDKKDKN